MAARGALRAILARYLPGAAPGDLRFDYARHGKPSLGGVAAGGAPRFNLSHSGDWALYAIAQNHDVGVDVEEVRAELASEQIAERFFSPLEVHSLRALPPELRVEAFFRCWTCKEAYLKARGQGLSSPLHRFSVAVSPHRPASLLHVEGEPEEANRWCLRALTPAPGYQAALAVEGALTRLCLWTWSAPL